MNENVNCLWCLSKASLYLSEYKYQVISYSSYSYFYGGILDIINFKFMNLLKLDYLKFENYKKFKLLSLEKIRISTFINFWQGLII